MSNINRNKPSSTKRTKLSSNRNKKYKLKSVKKSNKRQTVKYGGMESGEEASGEKVVEIMCSRCKGTGEVDFNFVEDGGGTPRKQVCNLCKGTKINRIPLYEVTAPVKKPAEKTSTELRRARSDTIYTQTKPDCWGHVLSKIIGAWENIILKKEEKERVTPHFVALNKMKEKGRALGIVGQGDKCYMVGGIGSLLTLLNHNNESDEGKQWEGQVINNIEEVKDLLNMKLPIYMEISKLVRKSDLSQLFNENHAVLAESIGDFNIKIFNSHGAGEETHRLMETVSDYMNQGKISFYLIWPKSIGKSKLQSLLTLEQWDVLRRVVEKK
jgi:hypothetical protein